MRCQMATVTRNTVRFGNNPYATVLAAPASQQHAFDLLGASLATDRSHKTTHPPRAEPTRSAASVRWQR